MKCFEKLKFRFVIDIRDDLNLHADSMKISTSQTLKLQRDLQSIENFRLADKILVPSQSLINYFLERFEGLNASKFITLPNASDPEHFLPTRPPEIPTIGIVGGMNHGQGFDLFLDAAIIVKKLIPSLEVKCAYNYIPQTAAYRQEILDKYNFEWLEFREDVFYSKNAPEFYSNLSVCVIPRRNTKINQVATPSKLFDAMATARPLVVTDLKEQRDIVTSENCGLVSDFKAESIADKIVQLLRNVDLAEQLGRNGRNAVEKSIIGKQGLKKLLITFSKNCSAKFLS